jgi:hypothetical protein
VVKKLDQDDSLTWHGITLYGQVDVGAVYQNHGAPLNNSAGAGWNYLIAKNSNARSLVWRPIRAAARSSS